MAARIGKQRCVLWMETRSRHLDCDLTKGELVGRWGVGGEGGGRR